MTNPFIDAVVQSLLDGGTLEMEGETYRLIRADQPVLTAAEWRDSIELLPTESIMLTIVRTQLERGETPSSAATAMLMLTIDRLTGVKDWSVKESDQEVST